MSEGLLCVNKPAGPTSHDVVQHVRRVIGIRRVGHTGTLDPQATGVLVLCIGRATRLAEYLAGQPKSYQAAVHLGQTTTTYDAEGEILEERPVNITRDQLDEALSGFRGTITQLPPMHSAVKIQGQPLYRKARAGLSVERAPRQVTIYRLDMTGWTPPILHLEVHCSSGTYIRSLAHDIGRVLGCGGYLAELERTAVGQFLVDAAVPLAVLDEHSWQEHLLPMETAIAHLPEVVFTQPEAEDLASGRFVSRSPDQIPESVPDEIVRAYDPEGRFIGIITRVGQLWKPRKIFYSALN